ncbi:MAG: (deoxy)nucleoside triphosphate pyrophosphohydrolase [Thermodesulfobacteriota bacterium]
MPPEIQPEIQVVAGILWRDGRFLAVRRPEGKPLAGYWEFPGGKVEPGEGLEQALVRELREELGLTPLRFALWREKTHVYPHMTVRLHFFRVAEHAGTPLSLEGHAIRWFAPGDVDGTPFLKPDIEIVAELAENPTE